MFLFSYSLNWFQSPLLQDIAWKVTLDCILNENVRLSAYTRAMAGTSTHSVALSFAFAPQTGRRLVSVRNYAAVRTPSARSSWPRRAFSLVDCERRSGILRPTEPGLRTRFVTRL